MRAALRSLRAAPGGCLLAIVILGLGIGATTLVFSVVDPIVIRRLPFQESDRLVAVQMTYRSFGSGTSFAPQEFLALAARQDVFQAFGATGAEQRFTRGTDATATTTHALEMTASVFKALEVQPLMGRVFTEDDERPERGRVAVIGYSLWQREFGGDPSVVGRSVAYTSGDVEILGVMPPGFTYPVGNHYPREMWVPWVPKNNERSLADPGRGQYMSVIARLKDGVSATAASTRLEQIAVGIRAETPIFHRDWTLAVRTLRDALFGRVSAWMWLLLGASGCLLLVACSNVANLMLLRAASREREIGIRLALGATRGRIARSMLAEATWLAGSATALGIGLAYWSLDLVKRNLPAGIPRAADIAVDARVLATAIGMGVVTALLVGIVPAVRRTPDPSVALGEMGRSFTAGRRRSRWHAALVISELALATTLVVGGALFVASFIRLVTKDLGFDYARVLSVPVELPPASAPAGKRDPVSDAVVLSALLDRVRNVPGLDSVALLYGTTPLQGGSTGTGVFIPGREREFQGRDALVESKRVTPEYFRVLGLRLIRGRLFTDADRQGAPPVAILSESAARRFFGSSEALGASIGFNGDRTVIGVVADTSFAGPERDTRPEGYLPFMQLPDANPYVLVRATGSVADVVGPVTAAIADALPGQRAKPDFLRDYFWRLTAERRFSVAVMGVVAALALFLAVLGVYGVMANIVRQRTREIGVRIALGAAPARVLRDVIAQALIYVLCGSAIGLAAAWGVARILTALLFEISPHQPAVYFAVIAILAAAGVTAAIAPARYAARVDPIVALRAE